MFASIALVVLQMAMYLTGYSDCLTGYSDCLTGYSDCLTGYSDCLTGYSDCLTSFLEPLLPPYRCHTGLKNGWHNHCLKAERVLKQELVFQVSSGVPFHPDWPFLKWVEYPTLTGDS